MINVKIKKNDVDIDVPLYATIGSAGLDLQSAHKETIRIYPNEVKLIKTGISIGLPDGYEAQVRSRSGLALKNGVFVLNSPGTIDQDYTGEVGVILANFGNDVFEINYKQKIAQMVITEYTKIVWDVVDELISTQRGDGGFGSTDKK